MKKKKLLQIVAGIKDYYKENDIRSNNITAVFYIVTGVLILGIAAAMFNLIH